jgi:hypothetical protein
MANQVQCPNCGGYKTETRTTLVDRRSNKPLLIQPQAAMWMMLFSTILCCAGFQTLIVWNAGPKDQSPWLCLGSMFLASIILFVLPVAKYGLNRTWSEAGYEVYHHRCYLCGYEWSRREDEPLPPVTVRPDLIAKGEQKLEEEREEEERRRRDAGGMFYPPP